MKTKVFLIILIHLLLIASSLSANPSKEEVRGAIIYGKLVENNQRFQGVRLIQLGLEQKVLVQAQIISDTFALELTQNLAAGVYKLLFLGGRDLQEEVLFIFDRKSTDLIIEIDFTGEEKNIQFFNSTENEKWYAYRKSEKKKIFKHEVLYNFIANYPDKDSKLTKVAIEEIEKVRSDIEKHQNSFVKNNKGTMAALIIENQPYFFYDPIAKRSESRKKEFENYWTNIKTNEPRLINTHVYPEHIIRYVRYYLDQAETLAPLELEIKLKTTIDQIMGLFSENEKTQAFAFEFLMNGFREIGQERVLQYLEESYAHIAEQCLDNINKTEFEERMRGYAKLKRGMPAPEIHFSFEQKLSEIKGDTTVLVFWSTECPHCMHMIPKVDEWAKKQQNITIIGISLDTNYEQYMETIQNLPNLKHHADGLGWDGPAVKEYFISATPSLIVLDKDKNIIDKFDGFEKMLSYLKQ
ncbi:MAG: TlpA family protein disulfide reductase [Crocinitomicaceae bacterium]|nr:TlpA family protein disulfide reductase [Crocinitomicaceae bacterium]